MNEELEKKIEEMSEMTKENNKILRSMRSHARWSNVIRLVYWIIIIGTAFGAYYFVKPVINDLTQAYDGVVESFKSAKEVGQKITSPFQNLNTTTTQK